MLFKLDKKQAIYLHCVPAEMHIIALDDLGYLLRFEDCQSVFNSNVISLIAKRKSLKGKEHISLTRIYLMKTLSNLI